MEKEQFVEYVQNCKEKYRKALIKKIELVKSEERRDAYIVALEAFNTIFRGI